MMDLLVYLWLAGVTVAQVLTGLALYGAHKRWDHYDRRELELHQAERMQRVIDLMGRHKMGQDQAIRRAAECLIVALEADPLSREKHWTAIELMRSKLAEP